MNNDKTTKKGHIKYSTDLKEFLKTFILGNKSDTVLWNAISRENEEVPNSTLKNAFNPNKDRLTINVVQSLLVFVVKKRIDNSDILDKLNGVFARFCFDDFNKKDKASIQKILRQKTLRRFKFYKIDSSELLIFDEKLLNEDYNPVQRYKSFDIKLENIVVEVEEIKEKIEYKKVEKDYQKNKQNLKDNFIDFTDFINERTTDFIGRKNVSKLFKEFKDKNDSGYFILTGKPGMGKSSYLSFLTKENNYIHHFINSDRQGRNRIEDVLGNLSFRIKEKYKYIEKENYITQLLESVSLELKKDEDCVIIIDGIDELKEFDSLEKGVNIFNFPRILPKGIYFVFSVRERNSFPLNAMNEYHFELHPDSEENESDIREYIRAFIEKTEIKNFVQKNNLSKSNFENLLYQKSEGNFMYLHCVLPQIEKGFYTDVKLEEIPNGLESYYNDHWERIKGKDEKSWFEYKLPIISMITLSDMSLSVEMIREYANLSKTAMVISVLEEWKQFFFEKNVGPEFMNIKLYKLYHSTFKEFLKRKAQIQAEQIDIKRFVKDFIIKYQKVYSSESQMEDFLALHKKLKGDMRVE